jgi:uncharacterized repeat protein (TIGR02543 family)
MMQLNGRKKLKGSKKLAAAKAAVCILLAAAILSVVSGCDMLVKDLLEGSLSEREANPISIFDHRSYFPIIEGYQWTYDDGTTVRVQNVDRAAGTFELVNTETSSSNEGTLGLDSHGAYIQGFFSETIIHHGYFPYNPVIYEDDALSPGFSWNEEHNSNGYRIEQELEVTGLGKDITTPGGQEYTDCLELTRTISYPEGYDQDPRIEQIVYSLKRGVGFVQEVRSWSDSSSETHYVVGHSELYTITYDANGADSGSVPVDNGAYLTGREAKVLGNRGNLGKTGYAFSGWNTEADGSGLSYDPDELLTMPDTDMVLYAVWEKIYAVGEQSSAGGYIFYDDEADGVDNIPGYRYLEAAPYGWYNGGDDPAFEWGGSGNTVGTTLSEIGFGAANTAAITSELGEGSYAAKVCADYSLNSYGIPYDDWFLPSRMELNLMYENLYLESSGGFLADTYWSSTENSSESHGYAYSQDFNDGYIWTGDSKQYQNHIRPIRAF